MIEAAPAEHHITWEYMFGVFIALLSGIINNLGTLLQKKAVNEYVRRQANVLACSGELARHEKLSHISMNMKELMLNKTWMGGFLMQLIIATALFIVAQVYLGPSLPPAIGSFGIIVIVFASCLLNEKLTWDEYIGIGIMCVGVFLLGFSDLEIDAKTQNFLGGFFIMRVAIFTGVITGICLFCKLWAKRRDQLEGTMHALMSGFCIALSNFWISPVTTVGVGLFQKYRGNPTFTDHSTVAIVFFVLIAVTILIGSNVIAIVERQLAFRVGHAATMIPISHIPSHLSAPLIYSLVFFLPQPQSYSLACMWVGIILLLVSSFIFGKREAVFEKNQRAADLEPEDDTVQLIP